MNSSETVDVSIRYRYGLGNTAFRWIKGKLKDAPLEEMISIAERMAREHHSRVASPDDSLFRLETLVIHKEQLTITISIRHHISAKGL